MNKKAEDILSSSRYATISTVDAEGKPWGAPVWYVISDSYIYWWSPVNSQHSKNIANNPDVYITIFNSQLPEGDGVGLYIRAEAEELNDERLIKTASDLFNASTEIFKVNLNNSSSDAPTRLYKAKLLKVWLNHDDEVDGMFVDTRIETKLD